MNVKHQRAIAEAWKAMNEQRARNGAPYDYDGYQSIGVKEWERLMNGLNDILIEETGKQAWLHPSLYASNVTGERETKRT